MTNSIGENTFIIINQIDAIKVFEFNSDNTIAFFIM